MRTFLTVAALLVLVSEPAWAQSYFQFGPPSARQYYLPPTYQYFTPPPRANRRVQPKAAVVQIPQPEKAAIVEEYAKGYEERFAEIAKSQGASYSCSWR